MALAARPTSAPEEAETDAISPEGSGSGFSVFKAGRSESVESEAHGPQVAAVMHAACLILRALRVLLRNCHNLSHILNVAKLERRSPGKTHARCHTDIPSYLCAC